MAKQTIVATERRTIQTALVELLTKNPYATDEEMCKVAMEIMPHSTYGPHRCQTDRRKFNKAIFKCQHGQVPSVLAVNPIKRPKQQSAEPVINPDQLELALS